jgi:ubiquinone/menaquinone biosynthesis C-methylase UbiE
MDDGIELRTTFDSVSELYKKARPNYPEELFDALVEWTQLSSGARLLEIGPGTGQATLSLAKRGYDITAIELSVEMANIARRELSDYKNVHVVTGSFEETEFAAGSFDLIYAASAFHWVPSNSKFTKPHALLKKNKHLAIIQTEHIIDDEYESFFYDTQPIHETYSMYRPKTPSDPKTPIRRIEDIEAQEFDEHLFKVVLYKLFPVKIKYTAKAYADLVNTFSNTIAMPEGPRSDFLKDLEDLIETKHGGSVIKPYVISLTIGQKID